MKYKQNIVAGMTEEINGKYAEKIYTEESLAALFEKYNKISLAVQDAADTGSADLLYSEWQGAVKLLKISIMHQTVSDKENGVSLGCITSGSGIYSLAIFDILPVNVPEALKTAAENASDGMKVYAVYDITLSIPNEDKGYTVKVLLPDACELVREYKVVYLCEDGTTETIDAVAGEDGYLTFDVTHLSEFYIMGKPPVDVKWMLVPWVLQCSLR